MMRFLEFLVSILVCIQTVEPSIDCNCQSEACDINVAVFGNANQKNEINSAIDVINERAEYNNYWKLSSSFYDLSAYSDDETKWNLTKKANELVNVNVLIGPIKGDEIHALHPTAIAKDWVHVAPYSSDQSLSKQIKYPNLIRMLPSDRFQAEAIVSLLSYYRITEISILGMDEGFGNVALDFLALRGRWNILVAKYFNVHVERSELQQILNEIKQFDSHAIILAVDVARGYMVLEEAYNMDMTVVNGWEWIAMSGITAQKIKPSVIQGKTQHFGGVIGTRQFHHNSPNTQLSDVITDKYIDSLLALEAGLNEICATEENGFSASQLRASILSTSGDNWSFNSSGSLSQAKYDIVQAVDLNWEVIGEWDSDNLLKMNTTTLVSEDAKFHLNVTTIDEYPFVYYENESMAGYCIDLLNELASAAGFEYTIKRVVDGQYGALDESTGKWTGMIGETKRGIADLAVGPITVTTGRSEAIDFLPSFINLGLKFIVNRTLGLDGKYHTSTYNPYAFLNPYAMSMYQAIGIAVVLLSMFLCFLAKVSPYGIRGHFFLSEKVEIANSLSWRKLTTRDRNSIKETRSEKRVLEEQEDAKNGMSFNNALYFVWAALFWQTPERVPRSISARVVTIGWYMAAVAFVASYTANMVAVVAQHFVPITLQSISDILIQNKIAFGTVENSAVETQLKSSGIELAVKLHNAIADTSNPKDFFVANVSQGMDFVKTTKFALLWDSIALDSLMVRSGCRLKTVSVGFGEIVFAFAMPKHSPHYQQLSRHILNFKDEGVMKRLKDKYFGNLDMCEFFGQMGHGGDSSVRRLCFTDLAGVFYFVGIAMALGVVILIAEWIIVVFSDVKKQDPNAPHTLKESFNRRKNRLISDIIHSWFPIFEVMEKWSILTLPQQESAENLVQKRKKGDLSSSKSRLKDLLRSNVSDTDIAKSS